MARRAGAWAAGAGVACLSIAAILGALAAPTAARAEDPIEYYASVDRNSIGLDETVRLTVTVALNGNDEPDPLELPKAPDFEILSQGRSSQMSFGFGSSGGGFQKTQIYTLVLRPTRQGDLHILPGLAVVDGKKYRTGQLTVHVGPPGSHPQRRAPSARHPSRSPFGQLPGAGAFPGFPGFPGDDWDPFAQLDTPPPSGDSVSLRASVDKREVYAGEQVTLTVYLLSRADVSGIQAFQMPKLDGFWTEELESPTQISGRTKVIDGVRYRVYLLRRRALFPLRAGELTIQPAEVDVTVGGSLFSRGRKLHRKSDATTITVKPLPDGAPAGFAAANVGEWKVEAEAEPSSVAFGDPITVRIRASGQGNLSSLEPPRLPAIPGMKIFDPTQTDEVKIQDRRYGGSRTLEYVLVPERAGGFTVPALELPYFDPASGTYQTARTQPISLQVLPGKGGKAAAAPPSPGAAAPDAGLADIRSATVVEPADLPLSARPWFLWALVLPGLALLGTAVVPRLAARRAAGDGGRRRRGAGKVARRRLAHARSLSEAGDPRFFEELDRALHAYLETRLGRGTAGLTREQLVAVLEQAGAPAASVAAVREVLEACDRGRFAPGSLGAGDAAAILAQATSAIDGLEAGALGGDAS